MTLLSRLFVLVAVALLPAIAIQAYNEFDLRRSRAVEVQEDALSIAKLAAAEQEQIVNGIHQVLVTLSELPAIKAKDAKACGDYLAAVKQRFDAFLILIAAGADGRTFCNTVGTSDSIDLSTRAYFVNAMKTDAFTVGERTVGILARRPTIQFALPFHGDDGRIGGIIVAALSLDWLADHLAQKGAPPGSALAIADRNGTYLARYPDNASAAGTKMAVSKTLNSDHSMTANIVDLDGVRRVVGFSDLGRESGGLVVSFGLNKAQAFAGIEQRTTRGISMIVFSTVLVLVLTTIGARRFIHRPLGQLAEAANAWRIGDYGRRVNIRGPIELRRVAAAFNIMAEALQVREQELQGAKESAEEAAAHITTIFESTTDCVMHIDRDWRITYLNKRALEHLNVSFSLIGRSFTDVFVELAQSIRFSALVEAMSTGDAIAFETHCSRSARWYTFNAYPSPDGLVVYFRDITAHKTALEERRLMEEQLHQSQKMEVAGQLTGGIAHDFNNLLTVVSLKLEAIEMRSAEEAIRQLAADAQFAADRGAKLTAQLLAFSRRQRLEPRLVSVNEIIREFQGLIAKAIGAECEVRLRLEERLWCCNIDPAQLQTALLNLVLNARDAMGNAGAVDIETRNAVLEKGAVAGCPPGSYVQVRVKDSGHGMAPGVLSRVFEPFFTTKEVGKGTGLGLSMVYGFVRQSGGDISIESTLGTGTTVILYLPKAAGAPYPQSLPARTPAMSPAVERTAPIEDDAVKAPRPTPVRVQSAAEITGTERILVVEDDPGILAATSNMLAQLGYQVTPARNGHEAMEIIERGQEFDLLFSDIVMPQGISGVELARAVKRRRRGIKVLLTSGYARDALKRLGALDEFAVIDKPFRGAELARRVRVALQEAGSE